MSKTKTVFCPLCNAKLVYKKIRQSHTFSCEACPFIGVEAYTITDIETLALKFK